MEGQLQSTITNGSYRTDPGKEKSPYWSNRSIRMPRCCANELKIGQYSGDAGMGLLNDQVPLVSPEEGRSPKGRKGYDPGRSALHRVSRGWTTAAGGLAISRNSVSSWGQLAGAGGSRVRISWYCPVSAPLTRSSPFWITAGLDPPRLCDRPDR